MMTRIERHSLKAAASGAAMLVTLTVALVAQPVLSRPAAAQSTPAAGAEPMPQAFADAVEIRIAELHHTLRITPAQEPLFRAYADVMRANAQAVNALFVQWAEADNFTAPARLKWYAQLTATHAEAINRLIAPFDALYQSLSDAQKAAADRHFEALQQRRLAQHAH